MNYNVELLYEIDAILGETPTWCVHNKVLYWIDIENKKFYEFSPEIKSLKGYDMPGVINSYALGDDGFIYVLLDEGLYKFDTSTEDLTFISAPDNHTEELGFNDGKCDRMGRFYVGSMEKNCINPLGAIYYINETMKFTEVEEPKFVMSNGMCWNDTMNIFYHVDTVNGNISGYDYDPETGAISNPIIVIHIDASEGEPDGLTIDTNGMLWVAHWGGYKISKWDPRTGTKLLEIPIPSEKVTSCVFGGKDLKDLYITTASLDSKGGRYAGSLFKVTLDIGGYEIPKFKTQ